MAFSQNVSLSSFTSLNKQFGKTHTGNLYQHNETKKKYVLKNKKVDIYGQGIFCHFLRRRLKNEEVALEKLSYDLYQLCGVATPHTMIVTAKPEIQKYKYKYTFSIGYDEVDVFDSGLKVEGATRSEIDDLIEEPEAEELYIASEFIDHCQSLDSLLNIKNESEKELRENAIKSQSIDGKPIHGLCETLPVFEFLYDYDALGCRFDNILFFNNGDSFQVCKIDPGQTCLLERPDGEPIETEGLTPLDEKKGGILRDFQHKTHAHWNFQVAYDSATYQQKLTGLKKITELSDEKIEDTVNNTAGAKYISQKKEIIKELKRRRDLFKDFYKKDLVDKAEVSPMTSSSTSLSVTHDQKTRNSSNEKLVMQPSCKKQDQPKKLMQHNTFFKPTNETFSYSKCLVDLFKNGFILGTLGFFFHYILFLCNTTPTPELEESRLFKKY